MEKTIIISGKPVRFKCTGAFLLRYRQLLNVDPIKQMGVLEEKLKKIKEKQKKQEENKGRELSLKDLSLEDMDIIYNMIWILAKTADPNTPELIDWVDSFDEFPIMEIFSELNTLIKSAFESNVKNKRQQKKTNTIVK